MRFLVLALILCASRIAFAAESRPNVLFAFADDWGRYASSYAEREPGGISDVVSTPSFDAVAREGVLFTRAFVNAPSCTPCRSSLLSGQYFWRTGRGAILQGAVWDESIPSYPLLLQDSGYHIGYTYKVWSPGSPADAPYGRENSYHAAGRRFNNFSQNAMGAADRQQAKERLLDEVRANFHSFLEARPEDAPFCYWFGPTNCHRKWAEGSAQKLWGLNPDDLQGKLPSFLPDVPTVRQDICDYLGEVQAFDAALGVLLAELERIGEAENTIVVVSGDHGIPGVPRGKCNLYDFGVRVPLAIRWPAAVPGGRVIEDFVSLPDLAPTFLEAAGSDVPDQMTGRSLVELLKSNGSGQLDPNRDHVLVGRERHVGGARTENLPYPERAIRTGDFLYIHTFQPDRWPMGTAPGYGEPSGPMPTYEELREQTGVAFADLDASPTKAWIVVNRDDAAVQRRFDLAVGRRPAHQLFDLRQDPDQVRNVADDPAYAETLQRLQKQLFDELRATGDPRVTEQPVPYEHPPFTVTAR